jgi:ATP/maltotriose-dependent transcriptional regulator MalT
LTIAEAGALDQLGRARVELLRGQIAFASTGGREAPALLLKAAKRIEPLDIELARETYLDAWAGALLAGGAAPVGTLREVAQAGRSAPQPTSAPRPSDVLLDGLAVVVTEGRAAAASKLRQAASVFAEREIDIAGGLRLGWLAGPAAIMLWDEENWYAVNYRQLQSVRAMGLLDHLPVYLISSGMNATWRGDFETAASLIAEADAIAEATGNRFLRYAGVMLACYRGKEAEASTLVEVEMRNASAAGQGVGIQWSQVVSAVLYNGLGRYEDALAEAHRASEEAPELYVSAWALPELIEAATRTGKTRLAVEALERLVEATSAGDSDWGLGILARSRALLSEGESAEGAYREAIDRLGRTQLRPELARAHLLYGEWLRREGRRSDGRAQLRAAHAQFTTIGMEAFAERARRELGATGETVRARTVDSRDELTAQERHVALLARDGMSNSEIGARLFLSQHTVAYHLRKVFSKLGISSRRELAAALPTSESQPVPA